MRLTETAPDTFGTIKSISGDEHFINRITSIGVTQGVEFQTVKNDKKMPVIFAANIIQDIINVISAHT